MFGGMENAGVAMVMARRESLPAAVHRPKSPLGKTYSLPPTGGVSNLVFGRQLGQLVGHRTAEQEVRGSHPGWTTASQGLKITGEIMLVVHNTLCQFR